MGTMDLPDVHAQSPTAEGIHIRYITSVHVMTNNVSLCGRIKGSHIAQGLRACISHKSLDLMLQLLPNTSLES